ncbi:MAG: phospholipase D-like domain-containing protein, partial [Thermoplasmata archaeon]
MTDLLTFLIENIILIVALTFLSLNVIFVFVILFAERDDPTRTLHWLLALLLLPVLVGVTLYIFFHQNHRRKRRRFEQKAQADLGISFSESPDSTGAEAPPAGSDGLPEYGELALLLSHADPSAPLAESNSVQLFVDGTEKFRALLDDLRAAEDNIHLEYYIMRNDPLAREILSVLEERVGAGVEVRLLLDALGGKAVRKLTSRLARRGAEVAFFYPGFARGNYRNHRKIAVIDGRIGYCGGYNIGEEYL